MLPKKMHLTVSVYRHPDEFPSAVLQFFAEAAMSNVESSVPWFRNLVNGVFASHDGVRFFVLLDDCRPIAALPIVENKTAWGNAVEALANYYTALYAPPLANHINEQLMAHLIDAIKAAHAPVTSFRFAPMDPQSTGYRTLFASLKALGLVPFNFFSFGNWYHYVQEDWPAYLKSREGTVRSTIKRMGKKFAASNGTLELICGGADLERGLTAYQHVYALSWKQAEPFADFVPGLIRTCAGQGWLRLGVAWLNDQPIAAQIWIVSNGKANIYKLAYDENFKAYAPGTLLTALLMAQAIDVDKVQEIDYLIGDDPYKAAWMSRRRERWGIIAYNPKTIGGLLGLGKEAASRLLKPMADRIKKRWRKPTS